MGSNEIYTIGREFGSLGKKVGQDLAKRQAIPIKAILVLIIDLLSVYFLILSRFLKGS